MDDSMGMPCMLVPTKGGIVVTEIEAIEILTGAEAIPISAGGVTGAEGAVTLVIKGAEAQVRAAKEIIVDVKGEKRSDVVRVNCDECPRHHSIFKKDPTIPTPCPGVWK